MFAATRLLIQSYHSWLARPRAAVMLFSCVSLLPVMSQSMVVQRAAYAGVASSSSTLRARLSDVESLRNARTSFDDGRVPLMSRLARRRNSSSVQTSDGIDPIFESLLRTSSSIFVLAAICGKFFPVLSE